MQPPPAARRSANYQPSVCNNDFIQSLQSDYKQEEHWRRQEQLKDYASRLVREETHPVALLELVDNLQRLGLGYHFDGPVKAALRRILVDGGGDSMADQDLHATALKFRLLRQHGFMVPQDIFMGFMDESGNFKTTPCMGVRGILSLYDASYLSMEGEDILDKGRAWALGYLREHLKRFPGHELDSKIEHALELPYHWTTPRLEARWFIEEFEKEDTKDNKLLELAKLDYNICQAEYQKELKALSSWWTNLGLAKQLTFSRDLIAESFVWGLEAVFQPQYAYARYCIAQLAQIISTIDDVYDIYGSRDELELFTDAVQRWDTNAIEQLPNYMKLCFLALFNIINDMGYNILQQRGWNILPLLKKMFADVCKAYLQEAVWYYEQYTPTTNEYLSNAWMTITSPSILSSAYFCMKLEISEEIIGVLNGYTDVVKWTSIISRLCDDLGTSKDEMARGDVKKSVQCYMHEATVNEEDAREHIKEIIRDAWKKLNKELVLGSPLPREFVESCMDSARIFHSFYQFGDGFAAQRNITKNRMQHLVVESIPLYKGSV